MNVKMNMSFKMARGTILMALMICLLLYPGLSADNTADTPAGKNNKKNLTQNFDMIKRNQSFVW